MNTRLIFLFLMGCSGPISPPPTSTTDTDVPVDPEGCDMPLSCIAGQGDTSFQPIDGSPMTLVHGPQGGWHVQAAVRAFSTTAILRIRPQLRVLSTGAVVAGGDGLADTYNMALAWNESTCTGDGFGAPLFAVLNDTGGVELPAICALEGERLELTVFIEDQDAETASCTTTGVAVLDPLDVEACAAL